MQPVRFHATRGGNPFFLTARRCHGGWSSLTCTNSAIRLPAERRALWRRTRGTAAPLRAAIGLCADSTCYGGREEVMLREKKVAQWSAAVRARAQPLMKAGDMSMLTDSICSGGKGRLKVGWLFHCCRRRPRNSPRTCGSTAAKTGRLSAAQARPGDGATATPTRPASPRSPADRTAASALGPSRPAGRESGATTRWRSAASAAAFQSPARSHNGAA